jgi:hypothetical protein
VREHNLNKRKYSVEKECIDEFQSGRKGCCEGASYDMYACQGIKWIYEIKKGNEELPSRRPNTRKKKETTEIDNQKR